MAYRVDPSHYCTEPGCRRPKASGEEVCSQCLRLARATGHHRAGTAGIPTTGGSFREFTPEVRELRAIEPRLPRCIAYLSLSGDVITLELTGEPRFTEADVETVIAALSYRRKAA